MNLKVFVGIPLAIAIFVAGNILIFGYFHNTASSLGNLNFNDILFPVSYFIWISVTFVVLIISMRETFKNRGGILYVLFFGLLLCAALTMTASSVRSYSERLVLTSQIQAQTQLQLDSLAKTNDYYTQYISYLQKQISDYQDSSTLLQQQIIAISSQIASQPPEVQTVIQQVINYTPIYTPVYIPVPQRLPRQGESDD